MNIAFMGTPPFAVTVLQRLVEDGWPVAAAVTQPDRPKNRGKKRTPTPVKAFAATQGIPVFQPENCRTAEAVEWIRALHPDVLVVAAYGQILSQALLDVPRITAINVHASLLPQYRGAAPINWAILRGDKETGVTIQYMAKGLDTGDILLAKATPIGPEEDAQALYDRLAVLGGEAASEALRLLEQGKAPRVPQIDSPQYQYAPLLSREMSPLDWTKDAGTLHNQVRGLIPWPCATAAFGGQICKIFRTVPSGSNVVGAAPGEILSAVPAGITVACGGGTALTIIELQPPGSRRMTAGAYLRGHKI